jgi:hypothetical protein
MNPNLIYLSHATFVGPSGATAAATYAFMSKDYRPPAESRAVESDIVINQNGRFKYVYDNGPGFKAWPPFSIICEDKFQAVVGATAGAQYARLREMWNYRGILGLQAPDDVHSVHWSNTSLERNFRVFPREVSDKIEYEVVVQFEEGQ